MIKRPLIMRVVDQFRFSAASRRANSSTELVSSRVTALINSGYLGGADGLHERAIMGNRGSEIEMMIVITDKGLQALATAYAEHWERVTVR
jgi:hypothetical protein